MADQNPTVTSLSLGDDTQNEVKQIAILLKCAIPAQKQIKTTLTHPSPQPTLPYELTTQSTVVATHSEPDPRVVPGTASVLRV